jgi:hypothetical protein
LFDSLKDWKFFWKFIHPFDAGFCIMVKVINEGSWCWIYPC